MPYKGSSEVIEALLTGSVDFIYDGVASGLPLIESGQFRVLAKLNDRPVPQLPELPTLAQAAGLPNLGEFSSWIGLVAPAGTPGAIIDKIQKEVARAYADPAVAAKLEKAGINPVASTPAEFDAFFRAEAVRWTNIFKDSGIKFE